MLFRSCGDDERGAGVRRVGDGRGRDHHRVQRGFPRGEAPRALPVRAGQRDAEPDVEGGGADDGGEAGLHGAT